MSANRKAVFQHFMSNFHCSFTGGKDGVFEHSRVYLRKLLESPDKSLSAEAMRLDPRLTSTDHGAIAYSMAKAISEDKELAPHFLDIELADKTLVVYFEHQAKAAKIERILAEVGAIGILSKPGERLSDHVVSDLYIIALDPAPKVVESVVAEMKKTFAPAAAAPVKIDEIGQPGDGGSSEVRDNDPDSTESDEEDKPKDKKKSAAKKDKAAEKDELESVRAEAKELGLNETVFVDKLSTCVLPKADVVSMFKSYLGEKSVAAVLSADIAGNKVTAGDELAERDRLIRVLASRGLLEGGVTPTVDASVLSVIEQHADAIDTKDGIRFVKSEEQWSNLVEDIAVAVNNAQERNKVFETAIQKTVPVKITAERAAELLAYVQEACTAHEDSVVVGLLSTMSKIVLAESGVAASVEEAVTRGAWHAYVVEATKPAPKPRLAEADLLDAIFGIANDALLNPVQA